MTRLLAGCALAVCLCVFDPGFRASAQVVVPAGPPPGRPPGAPVGTAQAGASSEPALVTGTVVDGESGAPVAGVVVSMLAAGARDSPGTPRVMTDAGGRFFFADAPAGKLTFAAEKAGWIPGSWGRNRPGGDAQPLDVRPGETRRDVTIRIWRYAAVSGRVVDDSGDPLVATDVRIFQQSFAAGRRQFAFVSRAITDDRGVYRFGTLLPGDYIVVVPGTVSSEPAALREAATTPATYLQTMTAVATAPMSLNRADGATGADRPFVSSILSLPGLPLADAAWTTFATTYHPSAASQSSAAVAHAVSGRDRAGTDITIRFTPTFQVKGSLTLPDGAAAAFHAVHLVPADAGDNVLVNVATAVTDARGSFTFYGVPAGSYVARVVRTPAPGAPFRLGVCGGTGEISFICTVADAPPPSGGTPMPTEDLLFAEAAVTVSDRHVDALALTFAAGVRATGRLEFEGTSTRPSPDVIRGLAVRVERADGLVFQPHGRGFSVDEPGRFTNEGQLVVPSTKPGRYLLRVTGVPAGWFFKGATHDGRDISETPFDFRGPIDDIVVTLTDRRTELQGDVNDANGRADTAAMVILFPAEPAARVDYGRTSRRVQSVPVNGGRYSLPAPPPGEYLLIAIPDDQSAGWQDPARLERLAPLAERITVADGQTIARTLRTRRLP